MATTRGFVERIEIGRGGLVTVTIVEGDASRSTYVISDLDADPERFNERLSKLAVLRDAMNRAEPVEIEHSAGDAGEEIDRAARISRDELDPPGSVEQVSGLVLQVAVDSQNALTANGEVHDNAQVVVLGLDGALSVLALDLQAPERLVAQAQLDVVREAYAQGELCRFLVTARDDGVRAIISVAPGSGGDDGRLDTVVLCGFVESLGLIRPAGTGGIAARLAVTRVTTAPELDGPGGTVDLAPFTPDLLELFVAEGAVTYSLVEAGLRDNVRMRLAYAPIRPGKPADPGDRPKPEDRGAVGFRDGTHPLLSGAGTAELAGSGDDAAQPKAALLLAAELLAPLASASRPIWVRIDREMLDRGPEAACTPGLPTTDLHVQSLRDLRIPYPALWVGQGCFNHGVYRFQLTTQEGAQLQLDGNAVCLYDSGVAGTRVGYACVEGDHVVTVEIPAYTCDTEFDLDVYRIR
jgi:hypothetical protein